MGLTPLTQTEILTTSLDISSRRPFSTRNRKTCREARDKFHHPCFWL